MKSGIIGLISGSSDSIESYSETVEQDGQMFSHSIQLEEIGHTKDGKPIYEGEAATETTDSEESISIKESTGEIVVTEKPVKSEKYTEVVVVPDEFAVVSSGEGIFAFELLNHAAGISAMRASLDLNEYAKQYYDAPDVDPWQVGFYGNIGEAEKGIVYGEEVFDDSEIGDLLERSQVNQLGFNYQIDGENMKMTMAESGYIEIYQPSNYSTEDFCNYILEEITPIASVET